MVWFDGLLRWPRSYSGILAGALLDCSSTWFGPDCVVMEQRHTRKELESQFIELGFLHIFVLVQSDTAQPTRKRLVVCSVQTWSVIRGGYWLRL